MEKSIQISSGAYDLNLTLPEIYEVTEGKRGYAVIINNFEFDDTRDNLPGGKKDSYRLKETFEGLQFIVDLNENLSGMEIEKCIRAYSRKNDHSKYNCFVCVLTSHGAYDKIFGRDGVAVDLPTVLGTILNCTSLIGKPKLFFIDACRGLDTHFNIEVPLTYPDYMICYSALPGTLAYMMDPKIDKFEGSIFIKSMCDVFRKHGEDEQLAHLLIRLKKAVNDRNGVGDNVQNVQSRDSLTKRCFFTPGKWICEVCHSCNDTDECLQCKHSTEDLQECTLRSTQGRMRREDKAQTNIYLLTDENQFKKEKDILVQAEKSTMFFKLYCTQPLLFLHDQFLSLTQTDIDSLCENGAEFKIIPAKYPLSEVFMSPLDNKWIRFSEDKQKHSKFVFERANKSVGEKQFLHIKPVDHSKFYLTMGFNGWWVRAKYHYGSVTEADAFWDIRCLKTNDGEGNILSKYMLVSKNSKDFVCVDRTKRLKGCDDNLDVSKMFMFKRV